MYPLTPWVKKLLVANIVAFIVMQTLPAVYVNLLVLFPPLAFVRPWTVFTYMFLHAGLTHLLFNMIGLFFFGPRLEVRLGARDFLWLYFLGGFGGAVFSFFFAPSSAVVGASAAVYAILLGFAMYWPQERIYIWAILPVPAWALATFLVVLTLYSGVSGSASRTAHFAHLGGLAFGFGYLKWRDWRQGAAKREFQKKLHQVPSAADSGAGGERATMQRWEAIELDELHELNREEVVNLMSKVSQFGVRSLTLAERQFLDRMAAR
jgi:membrane associated rhomboid family serine protease